MDKRPVAKMRVKIAREDKMQAIFGVREDKMSYQG